MNFTIRAFVGETRVSTAISYSKENKNHIFQSFPEKKKFPSLRNWMMFYTKKNANTSFKMEPSSSTPKPVVPDNATQALIRKYFTAFGLENNITPRSHCTTTTILYVLTNGNFLPVFFNRQTGMVKIGMSSSLRITQLTDIDTCKFFIKSSSYDFKPITLPVASEPKPGQRVIAIEHSMHQNAFYNSNNYYLDQMKKAMTDAGYFVKDFYYNNYAKKTCIEMINKDIWSTPGLYAKITGYYWYSAQDVRIIPVSTKVCISVKLNEWLAANPVTSSPPTSNPTTSTNSSYPPLPPSPAPAPTPSTTIASPV